MNIFTTLRYIAIVLLLCCAWCSNAQPDVYASYIIDTSSDFQQAYKVVDGDRVNAASISTAITAPVSYLRAGFPAVAAAGNAVNVVIQGGAGQALTGSMLSNITVRLYNSSGTNVATATGAQLELYQLSSGNNIYAVRFVTDPSANYSFNEVRLEINGLLSASLTSLKLFGIYYQQSCPAVLATSVSAYGTNLALTGYVDNPSFATDAATTNAATLTVPAGILTALAPAYLDLAFSLNGNAGDYAGFTIGQASAVLNSSLLSNINIQVYNSLGLQTDGKNGFSTTDLKDIGGGMYKLGFVTTTGSYNIARIRITLNGNTTATQDLKAYNAFHYRYNSKPVSISSAGALSSCSSITLTANDPSGGTAYAWSTGATSGSITAASTGTYSVQVTDGQGCTRYSVPLQVTIFPPATKPVIAGDTVQCAGTGGSLHTTPTYSAYLWSTGAATPSIATAGSGLYHVLVTDANGCTARDSVNVIINTVKPTIIGDTLLCAGIEGILRTSLTYAGYLWSTGATTATTPTTGAGSYSVQVTDAAGCTGKDTVIVTTAAFVPPLITGDTVLCDGTTGSLMVAAIYTAYLWNTGATTSSIPVNAPGTYSIRVTNASGCIGRDTVVVISPVSKPYINGDTILCTGASGTLYTASSYSSYLWSTGATTPSITVTAAGIYTLRVTGASGCTSRDTVTVMVLPQLHPVITGDTTLCPGASGTLGTSAAYSSYVWNTGETTSSIHITGTGLYYVLVAAPTGCPGRDSVTVSVLPVTPVVISGDTLLCPGAGGTLHTSGTYATYSWNTGAVTSSVNITSPGLYAVAVTNSTGCVLRDSVSVVADGINIVLDSVINIGCISNNFGRIVAHADMGVSPYTYVWSTGATSTAIYGLPAGTYSLVVTDAIGCKDTAVATLSQAVAPSVTHTITDVKCFGEATGSISLTIAGGSNNYSYSWSNGATTNPITDLAVGSYSVLVTDNQSQCSVSDVAAIQQPATAVSVQATATDETCKGGDGSIAILASGGIAPYTYSSGGVASGALIEHLMKGSYTVAATDANGCSISNTVTLKNSCDSSNNNGSVRVHNVITPNGDGQNDVFMIDNIDVYPHVSLQIFDKWGDVVYTENDYHNTWTGVDRKGNDLASGTYYYLVKLNTQNVQGAKSEYTGYIMIQR